MSTDFEDSAAEAGPLTSPVTDWAARALAAVPRPAAPAADPWEISLAVLIGMHPHVPGPAVKLLHLADRLGEVIIGPQQVGFDNHPVPWDRVQEIHTYSSIDRMLDSLVTFEADRVRKLFPPVPGRKWLVTRASEALLALVLSAADVASKEFRPLPGEIVYKGKMRRKEQRAGLLGTAALAAIPEAAESIIATAGVHGIPVTTIPGRVAAATQLRALTSSAQDLAGRIRAHTATESGSPGEASDPG